ncbi:Transcriptional activator HAP5 [Wickerhamiella sorbophila]|uniref:Transcriptional activator HAP5 n=1 Tax=Wickerhamiella sorbophila TaxID=45607 RepID=A0A2T0FK77_9ASCO|nr:Transcriptional activator HAP5 [Wickerhamiella sorbophila]PRT55379.1 Transcriptional activator HAP5 [Wickerhamiella sorbophila]
MEEEYEEGYETNDTDAFSNVAQGLSGENKAALVGYWQQAIDNIERIGEEGSAVSAFKATALPLARIKKVMKTDSEVCMISAEAPILFAKGCDIFITELTMRAWIHAEESKRRTLQRSDIANALQKSDMFDFLIDIVPREEAHTRRYTSAPGAGAATTSAAPSADLAMVDAHPEISQANAPVAVPEADPAQAPAPPSADAAAREGENEIMTSDKPNEGKPENFEEEFQYSYPDGNPVYSTVDVGFREF